MKKLLLGWVGAFEKFCRRPFRVKVIIAGDHAGRQLKRDICQYLEAQNIEVLDLGISDDMPKADYPDYARPVAERVVAGEFDRGILICGTGLGMSMAANRIKGARAALCTNEFMATMARQHNDANILVLGARVLGLDLAYAILKAFLAAEFEGGRHSLRLAKF